MSKAVTVVIDDDALEVFEDVAQRANLDVNSLVADAVRAYAKLLDQRGAEDEWVPSEEDLAALREADEALERGEVYTQDEVMAEARRITHGEGR